MFLAQVLVGSSIKLYKEILKLNITWLRIPTGRQEADQLDIYKRSQGVNSGLLETTPASGQDPVARSMVSVNPGQIP